MGPRTAEFGGDLRSRSPHAKGAILNNLQFPLGVITLNIARQHGGDGVII